MRDSIVFYRSFYEAISELPIEEQGIVYNAIYAYALDGIEPELTGAHKIIFLLVKPQIDANNDRHDNGNKGGRPKKTNGYSEEKPMVNNLKTNGYQDEKPNDNVNDNVNDNDNVNVNDLKKEAVKEKKKKSWADYYNNNIGLVSPIVAEEINSYELADEVIEEAIKEAVRCDVRKPKYICSILQNYKSHNIKTLEDVKALQVEHEKNRPRNKDKPSSAYVNPAQKEFENLDRFYAN